MSGERCVECMHLRVHHGWTSIGGHFRPHCQWGGCGCPFYVPRPTTEGGGESPADSQKESAQ